MPVSQFSSAKELSYLIEDYFSQTEGGLAGQSETEIKGNDKARQAQKKSADPGPATIAGLALFLGFNSRQEFDDYENNGKYAAVLKRGRLRIEALYEKKLHQQSATGAIFALKNMGWNEKNENKPGQFAIFKTLKIKIVETGPKPAENERDVIL